MSQSTIKAKAAIVRDINQAWQIEEVELAPIQADEVLIRVVGCGICHTDEACRTGEFPTAMPIVLGHEGSGIVEAIGDAVTGVKPGDHVVLSFDSCGECQNCKQDQPAYCFDFYPRNISGTRASDGSATVTQNGEAINAVFFCQSSFATYAVAREANTVVIDKSLPLEIMGPLGCGIQTGAGAAVNSLAIKAGDSLAIFGGGAVGLSALMGAKAVGADKVFVIEPNASRRALAMELGATDTIDPMANDNVLEALQTLSGGGVNYAIDTTGIPSVVAVAMEVLLPKGMLGLLGVPPAEATLPANMMSMLGRGVGAKYIIEGDADPQEFIPRMANWYQEGKFPFDKLIQKFAFEDINEAANASIRGDVIKPVLIF